jgi:hypothetical protein
MLKEVLALAITVVVHLLGGGVLLWHLMRSGTDDLRRGGGRGWWPQDPEPDLPPDPGGVPLLPDAEQGARRLRPPERLALPAPRPLRRSDHPPLPAREPVPHKLPQR